MTEERRFKRIVARVTVEYEVDVPIQCDADSFENWRNRGSFCSDNILEEIERFRDSLGPDGCLCGRVQSEFVRDIPGSERELTGGVQITIEAQATDTPQP